MSPPPPAEGDPRRPLFPAGPIAGDPGTAEGEDAAVSSKPRIPVLTEVVVPGGEAPAPVAVAPASPVAVPGAAEIEALLARHEARVEALIERRLEAATERILSTLEARFEPLLRSLGARPPEAKAENRPAGIAGTTLRPAGSSHTPEEAMDKTYSPGDIEQGWYETWERRGYFAPTGSGPPYCIMLPPPNVTGNLHMGHAFQDTLMDCLIRYHRMRGRRTLWQCGTDHAGIATQMVVERQLAAQGLRREALGREAFTDAVWRWKAQSGDAITRQLRRLGTSMDWSRERFTLDPGLSRAVTEVFVRLHEEGLIYRGKRLVNWDPVLHTAISDLEVVASEEAGHLWHIRYPFASGEGHLVVATTRPETLLGDVAVAVHPEDARYRHAIGQELALPLTGRIIPVIADPYVDPEFGSGCLKITPAHDFNDYEVGRRHGLPLVNILTVDGHLNGEVPDVYVGLERFEARKRVVADLAEAGLLERIEDHTLKVPRGDRSHAVIEPYLTDQWYVRVEPLAGPAIRAVEEGHIRFVPETWSKTYFEWMRNIEDWCISRQLWWGHRIPAWYDADGRVYVGRSETEVRSRHGLRSEHALTRDPDVLDTWFSSALWPFSTLGWPDETPELKSFYPTSVLVTGFDIIFFWVARMIMMGLKFTGQVPFREVYIHGLVRDADGQKMSKSKGNILDPLDLIDGIDLEALVVKRTAGLMQPETAARIEKATRRQFPRGIAGFGSDALRFTFAALATQGRDIRFDMGRIEGYRNFCNKLWNAARYVLMANAGRPVEDDGLRRAAGVGERWIRARLQQTAGAVAGALESYRFDLAAQAIHEFGWGEYCDWYLEWSKVSLLRGNGSDDLEACRRATRETLLSVFEGLLRIAHPFIPFITEELWQRIAPLVVEGGDSLMLEPYPVPEGAPVDLACIREFEWMKSFVLGVRRVRAELDLPPARPLKVLIKHGSSVEQRWLEQNRLHLTALGRTEPIEVLSGPPSPGMAVALAGDTTLYVSLAGLIDRDAELKRLDGEIKTLREEHARSTGKLGNRDYRERAPAEVVQREEQRCRDLSAALERLEAQQERVRSLA